MSGQYQYRGPDHLRVLAAHDPLAAQLYIRSLRSERIRATVSTLLRFVRRHVGLRAGTAAPPVKTVAASGE